MNCQKAQYLIQEYLEKELDTSKRIELTQHLLECAECREEMNQMERADTYFSRQPWLSPPESLRESIMAELSSTYPAGFLQDSPKKSTHRFWYILLPLGQFMLAASLLIIIRPEWQLPATLTRFLKRISTIGWEWSLILKTAGERLLKLIYLDKASFGDGIYDFLVQSPWAKLSLLLISLILTLYLNGRLLLARRHISKKV
jgi:hypothetical protein